jgi:hypothetical protein
MWFPYWMLVVLIGVPTAALWLVRIRGLRTRRKFSALNVLALTAASTIMGLFVASGKWGASGMVPIPGDDVCELGIGSGQISIRMPAAQPPQFAYPPWLVSHRNFYLVLSIVPEYALIPGAAPAASQVSVFLLPFALTSWGWLSWRLAVRLAPRRSAPGHCGSCAYDLTGNVSGTCPECGRAVERAA